MTDDALGRLEEALDHRFADRSLLEQALVHRSYLAESDTVESFERMEFLGDAVLQLAVTRYLYDTFPELPEGELAKIRAAVVNERVLAVIARDMDLGRALRLGHGEELTGGRDKSSILSDAIESVLGAVYLDAGFRAASQVVLAKWTPVITERAKAPGRRDYKTRLQELLAQRGQTPRYDVSDSGPEHAKAFTATVSIDGTVVGTGSGTSKKQAEQNAAQAASEAIDAGTS
ncbi:MAG: ribonuclease III [Acidimicrobiia bacterium]|nr:ribonuclease III [Acidimicrobiia bacterium]